jgi:hypothetical protein
LVGSNNPLVHKVRLSRGSNLILKLRVKDKVLSGTFFPASDVLDHKSVSVEPGKENVTHDSLNTLLLELKRLSAHNWTVAKVKTNSVSTMSISNNGGVRVVLLRF